MSKLPSAAMGKPTSRKQARAKRSGYHHGDLRASLVRSATEIVGERGVEGFTVAEAARRSGVSSGAPFRHFADREELLAAAGVLATEELRDRFAAAVDAGGEPAEELAGIAAAFVEYAIENPAGFELTHGARFGFRDSREMLAARRQLIDLLVPVGLGLAPDHESALELIGSVLALTNGLAVLAARGASGGRDLTAGEYAERARRATRAIVAGWNDT